MAYFSNGSEGMDYCAQWCDRCVHQPLEPAKGCAVWLAHLLYNGDRDQQPVLDVLIPRTVEGGNARCTMFRPRRQKPDGAKQQRFVIDTRAGEAPCR